MHRPAGLRVLGRPDRGVPIAPDVDADAVLPGLHERQGLRRRVHLAHGHLPDERRLRLQRVDRASVQRQPPPPALDALRLPQERRDLAHGLRVGP